MAVPELGSSWVSLPIVGWCLPPAWGCPGLLHPPWPVAFTFPTLPGAWASLEAALGFDITLNLCRIVTTGTFLFQCLKWQGPGLQAT